MLFIARCPVPDRCRSSWHWRAASREACLFHQQEERAEQTQRTHAAAGQHRRGSFEQGQHERKAKQRAAAAAAHILAKPARPEDAAVSRNGDRQLMALGPGQLSVVGLLMSSAIFRINEQLRSGGSLASGAGARIDWDGYASMQEFVEAASGVFDRLGDALNLDEETTLFRGIGVPRTPDEHYPDIAGFSQHLATGAAWRNEFVDAGFGFAATDPKVALSFNGDSEFPPKDAVLFEMVASRGLCAPGQEHRSVSLFEHTFDASILASAIGQVLFPLGTRWDVMSFDRNSEYGVPLARMRQRLSES